MRKLILAISNVQNEVGSADTASIRSSLPGLDSGLPEAASCLFTKSGARCLRPAEHVAADRSPASALSSWLEFAGLTAHLNCSPSPARRKTLGTTVIYIRKVPAERLGNASQVNYNDSADYLDQMIMQHWFRLASCHPSECVSTWPRWSDKCTRDRIRIVRQLHR